MREPGAGHALAQAAFFYLFSYLMSVSFAPCLADNAGSRKFSPRSIIVKDPSEIQTKELRRMYSQGVS